MLIVFRFEGEAMMGERIFFDLGSALRQLGVARDPNSTAGKLIERACALRISPDEHGSAPHVVATI